MPKSPRTPDADLTLSVHPSVVFRLGEEMIQDDVQALVELAKNAYDADSPTARIVVDTQDTSESDSVGAGTLVGRIEVRDRGTGMTRDEIVQHWLTVSGSPKRELKRRGGTTAKRRTPVGDKGLGRLGTQRLGRVLDLYTVVKGSGVAHRLTIPWDEFNVAERLDSVKFRLDQEPASLESHGTTLTIRGLRNLEHWRGAAVRDLERRLSAMISPFGDRGFKLTLKVDERAIDLLERPSAVRDRAMVRYQLSFRDQVLQVDGTVTQDYFRPDRGGADKRATFERAIGEDHGAAFLDWLETNKAKQVVALGVRADPDRYIRVGGTFHLSDIDGVQAESGRIVDPGPFSGEVDMVRLREELPSVFDSASDYSDFVKEINGIRIYRDGFGIPVSKDWLDLAARWTSGSSFYNLRPENIVGFIDLSAAGNPGLEETSSREQFRDTPAYRSFLAIMERWRRFTEHAQSFLRRSYTEFLSTLAAPDSAESPATPTALIERAAEQETQASKLLKRLSNARRTASTALTAAERQRREFDQTLFPDAVQQVDRATNQLREVLETIDAVVADVKVMRSRYTLQRDGLVGLRDQFEAIEDQLSEAWETVALGLTAEALSHEVAHVTDRLRQRTQTFLRGLKTPINEVKVRAYAEHILSSASTLSRQLAHLNPAMRYRREQRELVEVSSFMSEVATHFNQRWSDLEYALAVNVVVEHDFTVRVSPGRLTQVMDNLILNSEYWIRRRGSVVENAGAVHVVVNRGMVSIEDNGPGVDPALENLIFDPFVSGKQKRGRGLGLFVVRQLLETEGASIALSPIRGADGRRRRFVIEFPHREPS